jgi:hypothetical protein
LSQFLPFPKLARLSRECVVTEKIDGTNAQIYIEPHVVLWNGEQLPVATVNGLDIWAGSRTRLIFPGKTMDNFGFAAWVRENAEELVKLGPGRHFGEWWGKGIQRGYGQDGRHFSLFHTHGIAGLPECVNVVPTLYQGVFDTARINAVMETLWNDGSCAAPGFKNPEGIVIFHEHARVAFKKTFDDRHKEAA